MTHSEKVLYRSIFFLAILAIAFGTVFYHFQEDLSWLDAYYFSVVSLATVGYGDITPKTDLGKFVTTFYLLIGIGLLTTFLSLRMKKRTEQITDKRNKKKEEKNEQ